MTRSTQGCSVFPTFRTVTVHPAHPYTRVEKRELYIDLIASSQQESCTIFAVMQCAVLAAQHTYTSDRAYKTMEDNKCNTHIHTAVHQEVNTPVFH